jgi:hypothetical protein
MLMMNGHGSNDDDEDIEDMDATAQNVKADTSGSGSLVPKEKALPNVLQWYVGAYTPSPR